MKTARIHVSNLGRYGSRLTIDTCGYVTYHKSGRYAAASTEQLQEWATEGRTLAVRNAANLELAERAIAAWQAE